MLGLSPRSVAGRPLEEVAELPAAIGAALERRREINDQELLFAGRKGASVVALCSVRPVWDRSRRYLGALITLRPSDTIQRLVQRVVGAQARFSFADIVGESTAMQVAVRHARIAANSPAPVLLGGEPGVGKELFAHAIHNASPRADEPFVLLNCAAVPRTLLMGELVGYEGGQAGRPTSHDSEGRPGKLELAHGGTLLLEEVGALTVEAQTSLLRVIETQHLIRLGGQRVVAVDARIIATTSGDLERAVAEGRFRPELFYRLSVLTIDIPPLRARGDDILLLLDQIIAAMSRRLGRQALFAPEALSALRAYHWPGNVRELESTLERLLHMTEKSVLSLADLPPAIAQAFSASGAGYAAGAAPRDRLYDRHAAIERDAILRAGREAGGHLGHAAERLGISRATLWRKMKLYGLTKEHFWRTPPAGNQLAS
jgi:transcriptional activator for dhaKLM operon